MSGERKFWDFLRPKLKKYGHFERIESHETAIGTPDVEYCINGYNNRLELKHTASKKKGLRLRPAQAAWFKKRVKAGGQPWLLAHIEVDDLNGYVLIAGSDVPDLVNTTSINIWLETGVMVWADRLEIDQLVKYLATYLVTDSPSPAQDTQAQDSSRLILPSHLRKI